MMEKDKVQPKDTTAANGGLTPADEQLVRAFFKNHSPGVVADEGFSTRVMRELPDARRYRLNRIWTLTCSAAGVAMLCLLNGLSVLKSGILNLFGDIIGTATSISTAGHVSPLLVVCSLAVLATVGLVNLLGTDRQLFI